jgi:NAD(P)H-hydrate repair Nnr-like enzyme with NAD(P)H-hydrate dehydratase domain
MFDSLTHALFGNAGAANNIGQNATAIGGAQGSILSGVITSAMANQYTNAIKQKEQVSKSKKLFHGTVEVIQVANGYIVNIGRKEGYEYETYIADTITDVNDRIAAAIVAFQLEGK